MNPFGHCLRLATNSAFTPRRDDTKLPRDQTTRIALVVPHGLEGRGGIERMMSYLVRELRANHPDISATAYRTRLTHKPPWSHLSTPIALLRFAVDCTRGAIDVSHVNVAPRGSTYRKLLFVLICRFSRVGVIIHLHGSGYDEFFKTQTRIGQHLIRTMFSLADRVVVLGDHWHRFVVSELNVPISKVSIISNGVPEPTHIANPGGHPTKIVALGEVGFRKGTDILLTALSTLKDKNWALTIAGNGEIDKYKTEAHLLGLADKIHFTGWISEADAANTLASADFLVLASRAENQPVAILEAMARGLPVISTTVGAIPEQVEHGKTGLLVPPGDAIQLQAAISLLLDNPPLQRQFGAAARQRFASMYSIDLCAEKFAKLYRLSNHNGSSTPP